MKRISTPKSGIFDPRVLAAFTLCSVGLFLALFSLAANPSSDMTRSVADSPGESSLVQNHASSFSGNPAVAAASMPLVPTTAPVWAIENSPNGPTTRDSYLEGVTCVSGSDCWAVGYYASDPSGYSQTLIEHWNGISWSIATSPNTSATEHNELYGVTCMSASDCWAVGYHNSSSPPWFHTLIEHWDGTSWSIVTSPTPTAASDYDNVHLSGVTCASASQCWAVGEYGGNYYNGTPSQTLIVQWDGTQWSIVASPNYPTRTGESYYGNYLEGVTCTSLSQCWAVGYYWPAPDGPASTQTLIEQWDGTSWSIVSSPNILIGGSPSDNGLQGVTCTSGSDCWAVGSGGNTPASYNQTLIEQWNGTSWSIVTSPSNGNFGDGLAGVTCASALDCRAVGLAGDQTQTFVQWNGTSWSLAAPPSALPFNHLNGVTCASASDCWVVGSYYGTVGNHTLIETLTTSPVTITTSASPSNGGQTSGGSTYVSGTSVTVVATANSSYVFTDWTENGSRVSTSSNYTFTATSSRDLVANFTPPSTPTPTPTPTPGMITVTVKTSPTGRSFSVDGTTYTAQQRFRWTGGSTHTIATTSTQSGDSGVQYVWKKWSDQGAISHTVSPTGNTTYTATFTTQYYLTMTSGTGGRVTPASGWKNSGAAVSISATPARGYSFSNWTGTGTGSYSGPNNPASITMGGPITEAATFTHN